MAFGTTITVTVNAIGQVLNRVNDGNYASQYMKRTSTDEYVLDIQHSTETIKKGEIYAFERHLFRLTHTVFAVLGTSPERVYQSYVILRTQKGNDLTQAGYDSAGLVDLVDSGTVQADLWGWLS